MTLGACLKLLRSKWGGKKRLSYVRTHWKKLNWEPRRWSPNAGQLDALHYGALWIDLVYTISVVVPTEQKRTVLFWAALHFCSIANYVASWLKWLQMISNDSKWVNLSLVFLLISNLTKVLRLHQFLGTKTTEVNKSLKTNLSQKVTKSIL